MKRYITLLLSLLLCICLNGCSTSQSSSQLIPLTNGDAVQIDIDHDGTKDNVVFETDEDYTEDRDMTLSINDKVVYTVNKKYLVAVNRYEAKLYVTTTQDVFCSIIITSDNDYTVFARLIDLTHSDSKPFDVIASSNISTYGGLHDTQLTSVDHDTLTYDTEIMHNNIGGCYLTMNVIFTNNAFSVEQPVTITKILTTDQSDTLTTAKELKVYTSDNQSVTLPEGTEVLPKTIDSTTGFIELEANDQLYRTKATKSYQGLYFTNALFAG